MPSSKDLIAQMRLAQAGTLKRAESLNHKPAIVSIGKRDPETGQHEVLLTDGSVEVGEKRFNSALPEGSQVLGIPKAGGGWLLDERDVVVSPIAPVTEVATEKIKYLFAVLNEAGETELRVGGWQRRSKLVKTLDPGTGVIRASINNTGGNGFVVNLATSPVGQVDGAATTIEKITQSGVDWTYTYSLATGAYLSFTPPLCYGYGFWLASVTGTGVTGSTGSTGGNFVWLLDEPTTTLTSWSYSQQLANSTYTAQIYVLPTRMATWFESEVVGTVGEILANIDRVFVREVNQKLDRAIAEHSRYTTPFDTSYLAWYDSGGERPSTVRIDPSAGKYLDVNDSGFTILRPADLSQLRLKDFAGKIDAYDTAFAKAKTLKAKALKPDRTSSFALLDASYHPRTTTLKP